ncbi:MAG: DUF1846 domain-containing protein [Actinomycetota bacterium]
MKKTGFDSQKYIKEQTKAILNRVEKFGDKLYLEFGGKLCFDYHAARVLPGFDPNAKIRLLQSMKEKIDILLCIYAEDIEKGRVRGDFGITYDTATLKLIDDLRSWGLDILGVVITRFAGQHSPTVFKNKLERRGVKVYLHYPIDGYPSDIEKVCSSDGFGRNDYIDSRKPIVVITAPGPNSGKLSTCLSQLYHDHQRRINSGYAKFETFPIWNLPLKHPVNIAYEAATADIQDFNLVDPFHLNEYNEVAVNYNRDVESFPILKRIISRITSSSKTSMPLYNSPTDMGVNCAFFGIIDDKVCQEAAKQELIRRYFRYNSEYVMGIEKKETIEKVLRLMEELEVKVIDRKVVEVARESAREAEAKGKGNKGIFCGAAIELTDGRIVTGKNSKLLHAASSLVLNAAKILANIPDRIHLLSPQVIGQIAKLKKGVFNSESESLDLEETLIALSISATTNPTAELAMEKILDLRDCEMHMTHMPTPGDEVGLNRLGVNLTTDGKFSSNNLFISK